MPSPQTDNASNGPALASRPSWRLAFVDGDRAQSEALPPPPQKITFPKPELLEGAILVATRIVLVRAHTHRTSHSCRVEMEPIKNKLKIFVKTTVWLNAASRVGLQAWNWLEASAGSTKKNELKLAWTHFEQRCVVWQHCQTNQQWSGGGQWMPQGYTGRRRP